jgi:hypothetical protein
VEEALKVAEVWQAFSKLEPYDDSGELKESWRNLAPDYREKLNKSHLANMDWLTEWNQELTRMGGGGIKKGEEALRDLLKDAEKRKRQAKLQLQKAEEEEDFIRRGLSGLKIGDK